MSDYIDDIRRNEFVVNKLGESATNKPTGFDVGLEKVINSMQSLVDISNLTLSPQMSYYFARLNEQLKPHFLAYNKTISEIAEKYSNKEGKIEPTNLPFFNEERQRYLDSTIVHLDIEKIPTYKMLGIKQSCYNALFWIIYEENFPVAERKITNG